MKEVHLSISESTFNELRSHVLKTSLEDTAFAYVRPHRNNGQLIFEVVDWDPIHESNYESRSAYHLSLSFETQGKVIKKAHDLNASLVEFHSHSGYFPVKFSYSDFTGFEEFVPHVWWRLNGKPYIAIVFNQNGFDGLVWIENPNTPQQLNSIIVDSKKLQPTQRTLKEGVDYE